FGVHGSIALNMHSEKSDIDMVVYGSRNFRQVEKAIDTLVEAKVLKYSFSNLLDKMRHFKGRFKNTVFMYNAVRQPEEAHQKYGLFKYKPIKSIQFTCRVKTDEETMFRPAIYGVDDYRPTNAVSELPAARIPETVVSMIGCYRNVARKGDRIRVCGMLERVENLESGEVRWQAVVGSGASEEEHIWRI
ncbi:MAG: hypothetical protein QHH24_05395, partial [Candidatus Bathyarchaeota archaeon]|nr:hypothetical protein [Candidatus Bathyarchaeota archaeon]